MYFSFRSRTCIFPLGVVKKTLLSKRNVCCIFPSGVVIVFFLRESSMVFFLRESLLYFSFGSCQQFFLRELVNFPSGVVSKSGLDM